MLAGMDDETVIARRAALDIAPEVAAALAARRPVVALESSLIAHGVAPPANIEIARRLEAVVRAEGAVPATIGILGGRIRIGFDGAALDRLGRGEGVMKVSRRDLAVAVATRRDGGTTVAATMVCAHAAGIRVFATGGIGGVHRGFETSMDVSADLEELARTPVAVVCAGAKAILDLPRTLEVLETRGVPVVGFATDEFPAFYARASGLRTSARAADAAAAAAIVRAQLALGLGGVLIANPPPAATALPWPRVDSAVRSALAQAEVEGVRGPAVTPYLLARVAELTGGDSVAANLALLESNARVAARIAAAMR
jgi:pseudouridine-5'-phosphate glycosidase